MSKHKGDYPRDCYPTRAPRAIVTPALTGRTRLVAIEHSLTRSQSEREMAQNMRDEGRPNEADSYEASAAVLADLALEQTRVALAEAGS
jgi:hypothetical protein